MSQFELIQQTSVVDAAFDYFALDIGLEYGLVSNKVSPCGTKETYT
jgi:hypothetical protein